MGKAAAWGLLAATCLATGAQAADFQFDPGGFDLHGEAGGLFSAGAAWRVHGPDPRLLGKLDVPGQQNLCAADDCMSLNGQTAPNQRLVNATGLFSGTNFDNGDMNYPGHSIVAATSKLDANLRLMHGPWQLRVRGIGYFDPVNTGFDETHNNTIYQPAHTPRPDSITHQFARGVAWREIYLAYSGDRYGVTIGSQILHWGEANLCLFNTINEINPLDAGIARMPGMQLNEIARPVPMITAGGSFDSGLSAEAFYQLRWRPVIPDPEGSFFSTNNVVGGGRYVMVGLGQYSQDPNGEYHPGNLLGLISKASRTAYLMDSHTGEARNGGQYGLQLKYYAETLGSGTDFGLYFLNYHSRLPYFSAYAANASCTRNGTPGSFAAALVACRGFTTSPIGLEPLPVNTLRPFLDYPENIHLIGASFNTGVGRWSVAGEYAYRPNMPLQIQTGDVLFAGLAPAFPEQDIPVPANTGIAGITAPFTIPGHRRIAPDFLSLYRGYAGGEPQAGQRIPGYERFRVGQFALTGIRALGASDNPFGADQVLIVLEASGTNIFNLPPLARLQLDGGGDRTHYSPGADGTGAPGSQPDSLRINPTQQTRGFATSFSWGYRALVRLSYENAFAGIDLLPSLLFFHDITGYSPVTIANYVQGRKTLTAMLDSNLNRSLGASLQYQLYSGGGASRNLLLDRDNLSLSIRYSF